MVWDKTIPVGSQKLNLSDDALRANADALETALDKQHYFATGGTQTGDHRIPTGDTTARTGEYGTPQLGNIFLHDKDLVDHGWYVLQVYDGASWIDIGFLDTDVVRLSEPQVFTAGSVGTWVDVTVAAGVFAWDLDDGNFFRTSAATPIIAATLVQNPTGTLDAGANACHVTLELHMDGAGAHAVTFDTDYLPGWTAQPPVNPGANKVTLVHLTRRADGKWVYIVEWTD